MSWYLQVRCKGPPSEMPLLLSSLPLPGGASTPSCLQLLGPKMACCQAGAQRPPVHKVLPDPQTTNKAPSLGWLQQHVRRYLSSRRTGPLARAARNPVRLRQQDPSSMLSQSSPAAQQVVSHAAGATALAPQLLPAVCYQLALPHQAAALSMGRTHVRLRASPVHTAAPRCHHAWQQHMQQLHQLPVQVHPT